MMNSAAVYAIESRRDNGMTLGAMIQRTLLVFGCLGVAATARASLYVYNDESDVDALADAIHAAAEFFSF